MMLRVIVGSLLAFAGLAQGAPKVLQVPDGMPASTQAFISEREPKSTSAETSWIPHHGNFVMYGADSEIREAKNLSPEGADSLAGTVKKILSIDLAELLRSAPFASELVPPATPEALTYELMPLVILDVDTELKSKDETESGKKELVRSLTMSCSLYVQLLKGVKTQWNARYHVELAQEHLLTPELNIEGVRADLRGCLIEAQRLFAGHLDHSLKATGKYKLRAKYYGTIKGPLVESDLPDRVIWPDAFGLIELPKEHIVGEIESQQKTRR